MRHWKQSNGKLALKIAKSNKRALEHIKERVDLDKKKYKKKKKTRK